MINFNIFNSGTLVESGNKKNFIQQNKLDTLFIFHGLYGRARNWYSIAKKITLEYQFVVITVDLRNHGENEFMKDHSYELMSDDIIEIFNYLNIKNTNILGHSMGGKLAMLLALTHSHFVNKLIIVDIAPCNYPEIDEDVINNLIDLDLDLVKNRNDADKLLSITISEKSLRMFLLQNLQLINQSYKWSVNLRIIKKSLSNLRSFPVPKNYKQNHNNTLCIHGTKSNYVDEEKLDIFNKYFANISFKKIEDAGHWLHVEKPELFYATISDFLNN